MKKSEVYVTIAKSINETRAAEGKEFKKLNGNDIAAVFDAYVDFIGANIGDGKVLLPGIGNFVMTGRAARTGRNPKTGESVEIPASENVAFKLLGGFKDSLKKIV